MMYRLLIYGRVKCYPLKLKEFRNYCSGVSEKKRDIVFFGTDGFALKSLQQLHRSMQNGKVVNQLSVVVPTPKPPGRLCLVEKYARKHDIPLSTWPLPKEFPGDENLELGVVASFGHLIPQRIIKAFPLGILNVHGSLLPKYRGPAPIIHSLLNNDPETGITIMRIKPHKFDVGDIVAQETVPIDIHTTVVPLTEKLAEVGSNLLLKCVSNLDSYLAQCVTQPEEGVSLAPKIDDQLLGRLDWAVSSASQIYNRWRALHNKFKFWTTFHGDYIRLDAMQPPLSRLPDTINLQQVFGVPKEPSDVGAGRIVVDRKLKLILIRCREDWAPFRAVTINKKPVMSPMDFANGYLYKRRNDEHFFVLK